MTYRYFELGKNADPEREDSPEFKNAFTVHPVSEPNLMYRLHKRFSQIELEWTYLQIEQLQVCQIYTVYKYINVCSRTCLWFIDIKKPKQSLQSVDRLRHETFLCLIVRKTPQSLMPVIASKYR